MANRGYEGWTCEMVWVKDNTFILLSSWKVLSEVCFTKTHQYQLFFENLSHGLYITSHQADIIQCKGRQEDYVQFEKRNETRRKARHVNKGGKRPEKEKKKPQSVGKKFHPHSICPHPLFRTYDDYLADVQLMEDMHFYNHEIRGLFRSISFIHSSQGYARAINSPLHRQEGRNTRTIQEWIYRVVFFPQTHLFSSLVLHKVPTRRIDEKIRKSRLA